MAKKIYEEENIRAIAEKIREKTGEGTTYKVSEMPDGIERVYNEGKSQGTGGYDEGYKAGQKSEYDRFWDTFQENGNRNQYQCAFAMWNDELFKPKYDLLVTQTFGGTQMFWNSRITDIDEILNKLNKSLITEGCKNFSQMFQTSKTKTVPTLDISLANSLSYTFASNSIKTIKLLKVSENTVFHPQTFQNATALENITFEGVIGNDISIKDSNKLTHESLVSIINALKDFETSKTFTYHNGEYGNYSISETNLDPKGVEWTVTDAVLNGTTLICHGYNEDNNFYDVTITVTDINISAEDVAKIRTIQFDVASYNPEIYEFIVDVVIKVSGEPTQFKTLTLGNENLLKLTEAEKKKAIDKGWILA